MNGDGVPSSAVIRISLDDMARCSPSISANRQRIAQF
jgi:hypothetical protein